MTHAWNRVARASRVAAFAGLAALSFGFTVQAAPTPVDVAQAAREGGPAVKVDPRVQPAGVPSRGLARSGHVRGTQRHSVTLAAPSREKVATELGAPRKGVPLKIGIARDIPGLDTLAGARASFDWQAMGDGSRVADVQVTSEDAASIRVALLVTAIPAQAVLRFQAPGSDQYFQATGADIQAALAQNADAGASGAAARTWWSPVIDGPTLVMEIEIPAGIDPASVQLAVPQLAHLAASAQDNFTPQSAACEIDATCQAATWGSQENAVARMIFSDGTGSYACTGTLLADQDPASSIPYFLTANHCINTQTAASSLTTYWFYRSTACNSGVLGPYRQLTGGATLLYHTTATDTSFLRLNAAPPAGAVYAGWFVGSTPATGSTAVGLHHPGADLLKYSSGFVNDYLTCTAPTNGSFSCNEATAASSTFYDIIWNAGITEPGSSGSGLFLGSGYLIGQLYGGESSCPGGGEDAYGRFDVAFNTALKAWLAAAPQTLTIMKAGLGSGTVTSAPSGISCGAACSGSFPSGTSVTLTATPASGSRFGVWGPPCETSTTTCTVTMDSAKTVSATFLLAQQPLTVTNPGGGNVTSTPAGIQCPGTCSASFDPGTAVTLVQNGVAGRTFNGWTGACTGMASSCSVTMNAPVSVGVSYGFAAPVTPMTGNVALASNGATATASSSWSASYPPAGAIDGDRKGLKYGSGGVWMDATSNVYPDWLQVQFASPQTIDHVIVYSMQDNYFSPVEPTDTTPASTYVVQAFDVQAWNGAAWITVGSVTGNALAKRTVSFPATTTDSIRIVVNASRGGLSRIVEVEAWTAGSGGTPPPPTPTAGIALGSSANPSTAGQAVTFTASVTGAAGTPTGTVSFWDATTIPVCTQVPLSSGVASCTTSALASGSHSITAVYAPDAVYALGTQVTITQAVQAASPGGGGGGGASANVALATAGGVASSSSEASASYPAAAVIDGDRTGANFGHGGVWMDGTSAVFPDWVQVQFAGPQAIDHVVVYSMQDNYFMPVEPSDTMVFTRYGITAFDVQGWNGTAWVTLASVSGNTLVKRTVTFVPTTTDRIRIVVNAAKNSYTRIVEVEAWTTGGGGGGGGTPALATPTVALASSRNPSTLGDPVTFSATVSGSAGVPTGTVTFADGGVVLCGGAATLTSGVANCTPALLGTGTHSIVASYAGDASYDAAASTALVQSVQVAVGGGGTDTNVALASTGTVASASSQYGTAYPAAAVNDGDRKGVNYGRGGVWMDGTSGAFPDWVELDLPAAKTIDRVVVYSMQDNYFSPVEPSDTMTFKSYGVVDFDVQAWNGSAWATVASVTGNNLVKGAVGFAPVSADRVRVVVNAAKGTFSRIAEIEVWGQ